MFHSRHWQFFIIAGVLSILSLTTASDAQQITLTPSQTEGPYYGPNAPLKPDFRPDVEATTSASWPDLFVTGRVYNQYGIPQAAAKIDLWHADSAGVYDESSVLPVSPPVTYTLRGYVMADEKGNYSWSTIVPGLYQGRTRHIHFKVFETANSTAAVTSQLYFPTPYDTDADFNGTGDITNPTTLARDGIYRSTTSLLLEIVNQPAVDGYYQSEYDFVIQTNDAAPSGQDLTGDGQINVTDLELLQRGIREGWPAPVLNQDGSAAVDAGDVEKWLTATAQTNGLQQAYAYGDVNLDGQFNSTDLIRVFQAGEYEDGLSDNSLWSDGDWNGDGEFSSQDLIVAFQPGRYSSSTLAVAVPEPSVLATPCILLLLSAGRKKRTGW